VVTEGHFQGPRSEKSYLTKVKRCMHNATNIIVSFMGGRVNLLGILNSIVDQDKTIMCILCVFVHC
jgi:hypothetical protein